MNHGNPPSQFRRFSSRREPLDRSFLCARLKNARSYDRIAGYFSSSLVEVAGEELESISGTERMICNLDLDPADVETARAAQMAVRKSWCAFEPEKLIDGKGGEAARKRYAKLFEFLRSGKLQVRILPDEAFGLVHGKAGVITLADGTKTSFMGSANESKSAWRMNYELVWEDASAEAVRRAVNRQIAHRLIRKPLIDWGLRKFDQEAGQSGHEQVHKSSGFFG